MARFSDVLTIINGKNQSKVENPNGQYPIYGSGGIMGYADDYICESQTVIIGRKGNINKPIFVETPFWNVDTAFGLKANKDDLLPKYLYYFCEHFDFEKLNTTVTIPSLTKANLLNIEIQLPTIEQQKEIISQLDNVENIIFLRKQQLSKLDELVKSRFIEMFGDTILNPFRWDKDDLGAVCDVRDGTHDSPQYYETGYPLVTSKNVTGGKIDLTDCSLICEADYEKINERSKVDFGDIIMPMIGTVGKPVIVDLEPNFAIKNVSLIKFKAESKVINVYIRALLQSDYFDDAVLSKVRGGTQKFISLGDIRKLEILVPPVELQQQFAAFVEQTDKSKFDIQKSLEKLETLKKALMQKYFG